MKTQRLDKILSHHGFGSRKDAKKLLHSGSVTVNTLVCTNADMQIDICSDSVSVDGTDLQLRHHVYLMLNKPGEVVCSTKDGLHRTVIDILPSQYRINFLGGDLHPIGRLDIDTEGLLLLTTDGELTHRLTSPKKHISKKYFVILDKEVNETEQEYTRKECAKGFAIPHEGNEDGFICKESLLEWIPENTGEKTKKAYLTIYEGKYHQVKRMFLSLGNEVVYLQRVSVGCLDLDPRLALGECRELSEEELSMLQ